MKARLLGVMDAFWIVLALALGAFNLWAAMEAVWWPLRAVFVLSAGVCFVFAWRVARELDARS